MENVPAARNAKIAEPRLVTLELGTRTGNAAGVAKGMQDQSATNQLQIRFKNFFAQIGEKHPSLAEVMELCSEGDRLPSAVRMDSFCQCTW